MEMQEALLNLKNLQLLKVYLKLSGQDVLKS